MRCTQGRFTTTGRRGAKLSGLGPGKAVYAPLPMFHSSALFTGLSCALNASVPFGTRSRFSASRAMADIRRMEATMLAYTGKILNYILATPPSPDDASSPLELALGNEASEADIRAFAERFHCTVRDSYGSTEGIIIIRRDSSMPDGALGTADDNIAVYDPETGEECPRARFDADGRLLNAEEAVGEIVNTDPRATFEGYYNNEEARASKVRGGIYWSGDLAYRDEDGWFYFAGRSNEWLRVDSENFAAAPVERIVARHPHVRSVAVYAVPDERVGDRVMVAVEVDDRDAFDVEEFDEFLRAQPDLGTKWLPSFVRVSGELPEARQHEARQDAPAPRGVACAGHVVAPGARRTPATDVIGRHRVAGPSAAVALQRRHARVCRAGFDVRRCISSPGDRDNRRRYERDVVDRVDERAKEALR